MKQNTTNVDVKGYQCFEGPCCLHLQGEGWNKKKCWWGRVPPFRRTLLPPSSGWRLGRQDHVVNTQGPNFNSLHYGSFTQSLHNSVSEIMQCYSRFKITMHMGLIGLQMETCFFFCIAHKQT